MATGRANILSASKPIWPTSVPSGGDEHYRNSDGIIFMTLGKVLHIIPSLASVHGGPTYAVMAMMTNLNDKGFTNFVALSDDDGPGQRLPANAPERQLKNRFYFPKVFDFYTYTPAMAGWLKTHIRDFDLVHIHGLFSYVNILAGRVCHQQKVPYLVTPHGMANRYGMSHKPFRKAISFRFLERPLLNKAKAIHLTSQDEVSDFANHKITTDIRMIPLLVTPVLGENLDIPISDKKSSHIRQILFMGRLNPIKNLEAVLAALAQPDMANYHLLVCGEGEPSYKAHLRAKAKQLNIDSRIKWFGFVDGDKKAELFAQSDLFILPSFSESFGIVAIEAISAGLPLVLSHHVANAQMLSDSGLAKITDTSPASIAKELRAVSDWKNQSFIRKARIYFSTFYDETMISESLAILYKDILTLDKNRTDSN